MTAPNLLTSLPPELAVASLAHLDYNSIINICLTNYNLNQLCRDPIFWKNLIYAKFPGTQIPEGVEPMKFFKSLFGYNVTVNMISLAPNFSKSYDLEFKKLDNEQLNSILDIVEAGYRNSRYDIKINIEKGIIEREIMKKGYDKDTYFRQIRELRDELNLQSNIKAIYETTDENEAIRISLAGNYVVKINGNLIEFDGNKKSEFNYFISTVIYFIDPTASQFGVYQLIDSDTPPGSVALEGIIGQQSLPPIPGTLSLPQIPEVGPFILRKESSSYFDGENIKEKYHEITVINGNRRHHRIYDQNKFNILWHMPY